MKVFRTFWYKGKLSPYEYLCLGSFARHGHTMIVYSYDVLDLPSGVILKDASDILPESEFFTYKTGEGKGSPSAFSNLFRYELLLRYGDYWVDTDVVCMSNSVPSSELIFAYEDQNYINGAILRIPINHPLAFSLVSEARILGKNISWGQAGPTLITRLVSEQHLNKYATSTDKIYPIHYDHALDLLRPTMTSRIVADCSNASFLHLWNEMLKRSFIRKDILPPTGSYLYQLFETYELLPMFHSQYSSDEIELINSFSYTSRKRCYQEISFLKKINQDLVDEINALRRLLGINHSTLSPIPSMPTSSSINDQIRSLLKKLIR